LDKIFIKILALRQSIILVIFYIKDI